MTSKRAASIFLSSKYECMHNDSFDSASSNSLCWERTTWMDGHVCKANTIYHNRRWNVNFAKHRLSSIIDSFPPNIFQFKKKVSFLSLLFFKISFLYPPPFRRTCCRKEFKHQLSNENSRELCSHAVRFRLCRATSLTLRISLPRFSQWPYACGILKGDEKCPRKGGRIRIWNFLYIFFQAASSVTIKKEKKEFSSPEFERTSSF